MTGLWSDLSHMVRGLGRRPWVAVLAVVTLALGIGIATAVFSITEAVLFRPLPLEDSHRLVSMHTAHPSRGMDRVSVSYPDFLEWRAEKDLIEAAAVFMPLDRDLSGEGDPERLRVAWVGAGFFETTRSKPLIGRTLVDGDQDPGAPTAVVISEGLWRRRFGSDPGTLGRDIRLDGIPYTVVGVLPETQGWPITAQAWIPLQFGSSPPAWADRRSNHTWQVIGRLRLGVGLNEAERRIAAVAEAGSALAPEGRERGYTAFLLPLSRSELGDEGTAVFGLMGLAVFLVLLIACINVSNLLLTKAAARSREISLRSALGAGRGRLVFLLLGESLVLALIGGGLGLVVAFAALDPLMAMAPVEIPQFRSVQPNQVVFIGALGISLLASLLAGLIPALRASRANVADVLKEGGAQAGSARSAQRLRQTLVVAELALSLALLTGAGLTIRSFREQLRADPGFDTENLLAFEVRLPSSRYADDATVSLFYEQVVERLEGVPGVQQATVTSTVPLGGPGIGLYRVFLFEGEPEPPAGPEFMAQWVEVDPDYFRTMELPVLEGRAITEDDHASAPPVILVNETMARRFRAEESVVDRRIRSWRDENLYREIVGVVGDMKIDAISARPRPVVYVPQAQSPRREMSFLVRTAGDPTGVLPTVRRVIREVDPDVAVAQASSLQDIFYAGLSPVRLIMALFGAFGLVALILAVGGIYGLVAYAVTQQTREIGIRMALGAAPSTVRARVLRQGATLALIGLGAGSLLAFGFARLLSVMLFGLSWADPAAFLAAVGVLALSALAASYFPARRATGVNPVESLRHE